MSEKLSEIPVFENVRFGNFTIFNVPTILLSDPTPTGEFTIRDASIDLKLSKIYEHMKSSQIFEFNYDEFYR